MNKKNNRTETINTLYAQFPTKEKNNLAFPCTTNLLFMLNRFSNKVENRNQS